MIVARAIKRDIGDRQPYLRHLWALNRADYETIYIVGSAVRENRDFMDAIAADFVKETGWKEVDRRQYPAVLRRHDGSDQRVKNLLIVLRSNAPRDYVGEADEVDANTLNRMKSPILVMLVSLLLLACAGTPAGSTGETVTSSVLQPTDVLEPTDAAETTAPAAVAFKAIVLKGKGKKVVKFKIPEDAAAIAAITHKGRRNFIVHTIDANGELVGGLVNEIGNYKGTVLFDANAGEHSVAFEIDADGTWTITVKPVSAAPAWNPSTPLKGKGDNVYRLDPQSSGLVTLDLTFRGDGNFIVHGYSVDGIEGIANEIGNFSGQVLLPDGTFLLEILGYGGTWSIKPG